MIDHRLIRIFGERAKYMTDAEKKAAVEVLDYEMSNGPICGSGFRLYGIGDVVSAMKMVLHEKYDITMDDLMKGGRSRPMLYLRYCVLVSISRLSGESDRAVVKATGGHIDRSSMIHIRRSFDEQMMYDDFSEKYYTVFDGAKKILDRWITAGRQS